MSLEDRQRAKPGSAAGRLAELFMDISPTTKAHGFQQGGHVWIEMHRVEADALYDHLRERMSDDDSRHTTRPGPQP